MAVRVRPPQKKGLLDPKGRSPVVPAAVGYPPRGRGPEGVRAGEEEMSAEVTRDPLSFFPREKPDRFIGGRRDTLGTPAPRFNKNKTK